MGKVISFYLVIASMLFGCQQSQMSYEDFKAYLADEENGLSYAKKVNGIDIAIQYCPAEVLVAQQAGHKPLPAREADSLRHHYNQAFYFLLTLSKDGREVLNPANDFSHYSSLLQVLSFQMKEHVQLTTSKGKTIAVSDYVFHRSFGMSAGNQILFSFKKKELGPLDWVQFNLQEFGLGIGDIHFRLNTKDIESLPGVNDTNSQP